MQRRNVNHVLIKFAMDVLVTLAAVFLAFELRGVLPYGIPYAQTPHDRLTFAVAAAIIYPGTYFLLSLYDPNRTYRAVDEFQILTISGLMAGLGLAGVLHFILPDLSRLFLVYFYVLQFAMICAWRAIAHLLRSGKSEGATSHHTLLVGGGQAARHVLDRIHEDHGFSINLVGYLTDGEDIPSANGTFPRLGRLSDVSAVVDHHKVDDVLLALPAESYSQIQKLVVELATQACNVWVVPDYFSVLLYGSRVAELAGVPMISLKAPSLSGYQRVVKRAFDLSLCGLMMLIALPIMGVVAIAIKLTSPGPVLYKQLRVGENGKLFGMYKFRSMIVDADKHEHKLLSRDEHGRVVHQKTPDDPRVTPIGRFLRRKSIDELPQLLNVLKGEMSLVGPRPELPALVEHYELWQRGRLSVPQGMTGWWQVNGRSTKSTHMKVEDDLYYVQHYSLLLDLHILIKTVWVVLHGEGAY